MTVGITLIVVAVLAVFFFISLWHTFHGDIIPMMVWAVIVLVLVGIGFIGADLLDLINL